MTGQSEDIKLVTDNFEAFFLEPKMFYLRLFTDTEQQVSDVEANITFQYEHGVDETFTRLVHAEKYATISKAAREYVEKNTPTVKAEAFVIPSLGQKILFNLYIKLRHNPHPIRGFENLDAAIKWLHTF